MVISRPALAALALLAAAPVSRSAGPPETIAGTLVIHGGGEVADATLLAFAERARKAGGRLVVISTSGRPEAVRAAWRDRGLRKVVLSDGRDGRDASEANRASTLSQLASADAAWVSGDSDFAADALATLIGRGGVVGGAPPAGLLPGALVATRADTEAAVGSLAESLTEQPGRVGYGIETHAALVVDGRSLRAVGGGGVHVLLAASEHRPASRTRMPEGQVADHIALARAAIDRASPPFPPGEFPPAEVGGGTVFMLGGGPAPRRALEAFLREAGGRRAKIVIIHSALGHPPPARPRDLEVFREVGATDLQLLHAAGRAEASSPQFVGQIDAADGVWFTGGRQWRLVDLYLGTPVEDALRRLLNERDGAVGGTSAGATFCGDYLVRGNPLGNRQISAEGYERGLALVPGLAVDQHFTQRNRMPDLLDLKRRFPQLLAIGIDEATAAVVSGSTLRVVGLGSVTILDRPIEVELPSQNKHFTVLERGDRYDLKKRKTIFRWPRADPAVDPE